VVTDFELAEHETVLLREAVRVADICADLQARVTADGPVLDGRSGNLKADAYLRDLYRAGAQGFFDAIAFHPYTYPLLRSPWLGDDMPRIRDTSRSAVA
jgi:hypothetical protein